MSVSSEMFLSVIILLQSSMPCSENFNRYKRNYEKYLLSNPDAKDKTWTSEEVRMIASPRLMSKLNPISEMSLDTQGINFDPDSKKMLLQNAANKSKGPTEEDESTGGDQTKEIPIANFRSNKLSQLDRKQRAEEVQKLMQSGKDQVPSSDGFVRLPNIVKNTPKSGVTQQAQ